MPINFFLILSAVLGPILEKFENNMRNESENSELSRCHTRLKNREFSSVQERPDNTPTFIHAYSNHPPAILKQIPKSVGQRVSSRSSSKDEFDKAAPLYNVALKASGFKESAPFVEIDNQERKKNSKRNRHRNVIWFNPPYSKNVETNVGKRFLKLLDDHFPKNHKLHKIFNRKNVKVSYGCVDNIAQIIEKHNKKVLTPEKPECPLDGACLTKSIVYQAEVKTGDGQTKQYIGIHHAYTMHTPCINNLLEIQNTGSTLRLCQNTSGN